MAKKQKKNRKGMGFALFMVIYAVLALTGIYFGLKWFWGFMEAYEASRPHIAIEAYMDSLTKEHVVEGCRDILEEADLNIQSEEECLGYLRDAVKGEITYARKASACTETEHTYVLRCGGRVIGYFVIETSQEDAYGFTPWVFKEDGFDLSELMGTETVSVTVPAGYTVWINGVQLNEDYITDVEVLPYEILEEFADTYEVPVLEMQTYKAGPFLNAELTMEVRDPQGQPFVMDETFDKNTLIAMTDDTKIGKIDKFLDEFFDAYVLFTGCANDNRYANYAEVIRYVVPESRLAQRMREALDGLMYAQSRGDKVAEILVHHYVELPDGRYMVDVTYKVDTTGNQGVVQTVNNAKMILVESNGRLLVESMIGY